MAVQRPRLSLPVRPRGRSRIRRPDRSTVDDPAGDRANLRPHRSSNLSNSRAAAFMSRLQAKRNSQRTRRSQRRGEDRDIMVLNKQASLAGRRTSPSRSRGELAKFDMLDSTNHSANSVSKTASAHTYHSDASSSLPPFSVPSDSMLSPRSDGWIFLFLSSCASTASLSVSSPEEWRGTGEKMALASMGMSTVIAFGMAVAFRYRPSRAALTRPLNGDAALRGGLAVTLELFVALSGLFLSLLSASLVFQPEGYMAVSEGEIWNANLFFSTWVSCSLASYLVADLITVHDSAGILPKEYGLVMANAIPRGWTLLFIAAVSLLAFNISLKSSPACSGFMGQTNVCEMTMVGIIFGVLGMLIAGVYLLISLLERKPSLSLNRHARLRGHRLPAMSAPSAPRKNLVSSILSGTALICYSINAAFVTSPNPYEGMSEPANVYFSSWICFAISLYLCIRHAEVYLVPGAARDPNTLGNPKSRGELMTFRRVSSSRSDQSTAPQSAYSDDETLQDADDVLTQMVESQSEDGPMLFLPVNGDGALEAASDIDDDASYPSVTPWQPQYQLKNSPAQQKEPVQGYAIPQAQINQGREPHKPREMNPSGVKQLGKSFVGGPKPNLGGEASAAKSARSIATKSKSRAEPEGTTNGRRTPSPGTRRPPSPGRPRPPSPGRAKRDPFTSGPASVMEPSVIGGIDARTQAPFASSSESGSSKRTGGGNKNRGPYDPKNLGNLRGNGSGAASPQVASGRSFHVDERIRTGASNKSSEFVVETVGSGSTSAHTNPLDRTTRPPPRSFGRQRGEGRDPSFRAPPPAPPRPMQAPQQQQQQHRPSEELDSMRDSTTGTSVAPTESAASRSKSNSSKSSGSKSRSSSRKKKRSKSRDRSSRGVKPSKSPASKKRELRRSNTGHSSSRGPPTISHDSSGPGGPPTMSASGSVPLTASTPDDDDDVQMGHVGPRDVRAQSPRTPGTLEGEGAPIRCINGSPDNMSMVSEPTMDGFGPPEVSGRAEGSLRYSNADLRTSKSRSQGSDETTENQAIRQGAVDKMVMEALRQAQEARQSGGAAMNNPPLTSMGAAAPPPPMRLASHGTNLMSQGTNPQGQSVHGSYCVPPPPPPALKKGSSMHSRASNLSKSGGSGPSSYSVRSRSQHSRRSTSKSPHAAKKLIGIEKKNLRYTAQGSGSGGRMAGGSVHSFYSASEPGTQAGSFDADDAFAC